MKMVLGIDTCIVQMKRKINFLRLSYVAILFFVFFFFFFFFFSVVIFRNVRAICDDDDDDDSFQYNSFL